MKKIIIAIPVILLGVLIAPAYAGATANNASASAITKKKVHKPVRKERNSNWDFYMAKQQFAIDFPNATNATWSQERFAEVSFTNGNTVEKAYYDDDNNLIGTTTNVAYSTLPAKGQSAIEKDFPGYTTSKVILYKDNEDNDVDMFLDLMPSSNQDTYFAELNKGDKNIAVRIDLDGQVTFFRDL